MLSFETPSNIPCYASLAESIVHYHECTLYDHFVFYCNNFFNSLYHLAITFDL